MFALGEALGEIDGEIFVEEVFSSSVTLLFLVVVVLLLLLLLLLLGSGGGRTASLWAVSGVELKRKTERLDAPGE